MANKKIYNSRLLMLSEIEAKEVDKIVEAIYYFNEEESQKVINVLEHPSYKPEPIRIVLKSEGGSMYDGLALIDVIENSKIPIHITAHGCVMSMALNVLVSGHEKYCSKNTTFMYHEGWYSIPESNIQEHKDELQEAERLNELCDNYLISKTKFTIEILEKIRKSRKNWYFDANEALKYGVVNKIL